jgi:hypothetical protein
VAARRRGWSEGGRLAEVVRQLCGGLVGAGPEHGLESLAIARVQAGATRRRDALEEGLAHEIVSEAVAARLVMLHDQPGGKRRLDDVQDLVV